VQVFKLPLDRRTDRPRREVQKVNDKLVGMLSLNAVVSQGVRREIAKVEGDDYIGPAPNRGGQDMPVVRIGKNNGRNQVFVVSDQAIAYMDVHQGASALELFTTQVRPILQDVSNPFVMDGVSPFSAKKAGQGQVHQKVAQRGWVEDTGVVNRREIRHGQ